jgi:hypothetical protein
MSNTGRPSEKKEQTPVKLSSTALAPPTLKTAQASDHVSFSVADIPGSANKSLTISYSDPEERYKDAAGYDLELMSNLPGNDQKQARIGKIYLSPNYDSYLVRDPQGEIQTGSLKDIDINLSDLSNPLGDKTLKDKILEVTSKAGHTHAGLMIYSADLGYAFRDDFLLMSIDDDTDINSDIKQAELRKISDNAGNKAILIKQGKPGEERIIVYGHSEGPKGMEWKTTTLLPPASSALFSNLQFPGKNDGVLPADKGLITPEIYVETRWKSNAHHYIFEQSMTPSDDKKKWSVTLNRPMPADIRGEFSFLPGITPASKSAEKRQALNTPHPDAMIALENGKPNPWIYPDATLIEKGRLEKYRLKIDGSLTGPTTDGKDKLKDDERFITLYLPPGYEPQRKAPYSLQITLDGTEDNIKDLQFNTSLDNLIMAKQIDPVIVAFVPYSDGNPKPDDVNKIRFQEYGCNPNTAKKLASLPERLHDSLKLNINPKSPETTTMCGFSMGANQGIYTALLYPEVFGNVIAQSPAVWWASLNRILMLPDGASLPSSIPNDAILIKMVAHQVSIYKMLDGELVRDNVLNNLPQDKLSEIVSHFPRTGEKPKEITTKEHPNLFDKITLLCTFPPGALPYLNDDQEYLSKVVESRVDVRSDVKIKPLPINFYITSGDLELGDRPGKGVTPAKERFVRMLETEEHYKVITNETYRGGHDKASVRSDIAKLQIAVSQTVQLSNVSQTELSSNASKNKSEEKVPTVVSSAFIVAKRTPISRANEARIANKSNESNLSDNLLSTNIKKNKP